MESVGALHPLKHITEGARDDLAPFCGAHFIFRA